MAAIPPPPTEAQRQAAQRAHHPGCFACGESSDDGLGLEFQVQADGSVSTEWICPARFRSYDGILHGGLIATVLDSAMVHALFARGIVARTAELTVRYHLPVYLEKPIFITARFRHHVSPLHLGEASVWQNDKLCARAQSKFLSSRN